MSTYLRTEIQAMCGGPMGKEQQDTSDSQMNSRVTSNSRCESAFRNRQIDGAILLRIKSFVVCLQHCCVGYQLRACCQLSCAFSWFWAFFSCAWVRDIRFHIVLDCLDIFFCWYPDIVVLVVALSEKLACINFDLIWLAIACCYICVQYRAAVLCLPISPLNPKAVFQCCFWKDNDRVRFVFRNTDFFRCVDWSVRARQPIVFVFTLKKFALLWNEFLIDSFQRSMCLCVSLFFQSLADYPAFIGLCPHIFIFLHHILCSPFREDSQRLAAAEAYWVLRQLHQLRYRPLVNCCYLCVEKKLTLFSF